MYKCGRSAFDRSEFKNQEPKRRREKNELGTHTHTHIVRTTSEWNVEQDSCEFI